MVYLFVIIITFIAYFISLKLKARFSISLLNPVLVSMFIIIMLLKVLRIDIQYYQSGSHIITDLLGPIIIVLAVPLYRKKELLKKNWMAITIGIITSIIVSFTTVYGFSKIFSFEKLLINSLLPKSVTTPLALESLEIIGGYPPVTILAVILTGITGALLAPLVMRLFKIESELAKGIGIGASSHAIGTSKAIEMSEEAGAASGLALGLSGIVTVIVLTILSLLK